MYVWLLNLAKKFGGPNKMYERKFAFFQGEIDAQIPYREYKSLYF